MKNTESVEYTIITCKLEDLDSLIIVVPEEKAIRANLVLEKILNLLSISDSKYLLDLLKLGGVPCREIKKQIVGRSNGIWKLVIVTNEFYYYIEENTEDIASCIMYKTQVKEELFSDNFIADDEYIKVLAEIVTGKKTVLYLSEEIRVILPDLRQFIETVIGEE